MGQTVQGLVVADEIELRFAMSGKVGSVHVTPGEEIKPGKVVAQLDTKLMQTELDRQLAKYEKVRAEFEIYQQKSKDRTGEVAKYQATIEQSQLDSAVKDVELAKFDVDNSSLISPIHGRVVSLSGIRPGIFVSTASHPVFLSDYATIRFVFPIPQQLIQTFLQPKSIQIHIHHGISLTTSTLPVTQGTNGQFTIHASLAGHNHLLSGMTGEAHFDLS